MSTVAALGGNIASEPTERAASSRNKKKSAEAKDDSTATPEATGDDVEPPGGGGGGGSQLVRVTVNLTPRSYGALERATDLTGDNRTDVVNRALLVYALVHELIEQGGGTLTIVNKDGQRERIHLI